VIGEGQMRLGTNLKLTEDIFCLCFASQLKDTIIRTRVDLILDMPLDEYTVATERAFDEI
jgi:hypothetical protein